MPTVPVSELVKRISEPIKVLASFAENSVKIHFFNWQNRTYKVESMNLFHIEKDGDKRYYHFAVSVKGNSYSLSYDPVTLNWQLHEVVSL